MSKYIKLWEWISENGTDNFQMTFDEIEHIAGCPMDHSVKTAADINRLIRNRKRNG